MPLETRTKLINGREYEVRQLDALKGRSVFLRLAKYAIPALTEIKEAASSPASEGEDAALKILGGSLSKIAESVTEEDFNFFCDTLAPTTCVEIDGKRPQLDRVFPVHFAGNYAEMLGWLAFAFEVNFGSFFVGTGRTQGSSGLSTK